MVIVFSLVGGVIFLELVDPLELVLNLDCAEAGRECLIISPRVSLVFGLVVFVVFVFVGASILQVSFGPEDPMLTAISKSPIHKLEIEPTLRQSIKCIVDFLPRLIKAILTPPRVINSRQVHILNISYIVAVF